MSDLTVQEILDNPTPEPHVHEADYIAELVEREAVLRAEVLRWREAARSLVEVLATHERRLRQLIEGGDR